ncbi:DUF6214 family protein [Streptomyces sp. B21-105]
MSFTDGARVDLLAVVCEGRVSIEDVRARPALSLVDLTLLADWIEGPLFDGPDEDEDEGEGEDGSEGEGGVGCPAAAGHRAEEPFGSRRARPVWPRGVEGRWLAAQEYRAAQEAGADPVLAVMCATGHSRRRSLRLIAQARDAGYLTPRHARR